MSLIGMPYLIKKIIETIKDKKNPVQEAMDLKYIKSILFEKNVTVKIINNRIKRRCIDLWNTGPVIINKIPAVKAKKIQKGCVSIEFKPNDTNGNKAKIKNNIELFFENIDSINQCLFAKKVWKLYIFL